MTQHPHDPSARPKKAPAITAEDIYLACRADFLSVRQSLQEMTEALLHRLGPENVQVVETELVLAEVLNNIVEHSYQNSGEGLIEIGVQFKPDGFHFTVHDHGLPMPGLTLPESKRAKTAGPMQDLPEGGFGWFMIHMMTQDCCYERENNRNTLTFTVPKTPKSVDA